MSIPARPPDAPPPRSGVSDGGLCYVGCLLHRLANKFLMVYCPSSSPRDDKRHISFCKTLTDPEVRQGLIKGVEDPHIVPTPHS